MQSTKVRVVMTHNPSIIDPDSNLKDAAMKMREINCGILPVGKNAGQLEGIITDRDIVIRAVAQGKDVTHEKVGNHMTTELFYCNEDDTL